MLTALRLPFSFDAARLRADLAAVSADEWSPHYNQFDFGGIWRGAALRSASGAPTQLAAEAPDFRDTRLMDRCPYFREAVSAFECPLKSVRLLSLEPGSFIREHSDHALDFEDGEVRIHIPVQTNRGVEFYVDGERLLFEAGGAYYVNVNLPHRVNNRGAEPRIHLVVDAEVNDWVRALFARSSPVASAPPSERGVEAFRDALLERPGLAGALREISGGAEFAAAAVRLGREHGFDFHENDVDAMLRGRARPGPPGGLPYAVSIAGGRARVEWLDAADRAFPEPFFEQTVSACLKAPYVRFTRRVASLDPAVDPAAPAGLIFHVSRCGSTLAARMLSAAGFRVLSEPPPVDAAIQSGRVDWVRAIASSLGAGQPYFIKLDSWHIHALPLLREAFPATPWIFLYRDPVEVLVSHARGPGRQMLPGGLDPHALGLSSADITAIPRAEWPARVLAGFYTAALLHREDPRGLYVDYRELPDALWGPVARHFGIAADIAAMREATRVHAKNPAAEFEPDTAAKQREGAALAEFAAAAGLTRLYDELRALPSRDHSALA